MGKNKESLSSHQRGRFLDVKRAFLHIEETPSLYSLIIFLH
ncbi:hypothetical protein HMPREF0973_02832 [Prevotella veroralis F0319]|uniref:Uncharacterized protein n=1 Tax=Prevotella veroralis F0319 TaxID=649761 RepID=C9MT62_9BACT|nr:hypothetical protein HMPREF0973_02832 [Prevotella veroralis F0319]